MKFSAFDALLKRAIRKKVWAVKKKAIRQVLTSRCRRDGMPEQGRFTPRDIERIALRAELNAKALMPRFHDLDNAGNYAMEYGGLLDLAMYRALVLEEIERNYAMSLVGDMIWQSQVNAKSFIPILDPLRIKLAKLRTKDATAYLGWRLEEGIKFPYSEPGYKAALSKEGNVYRMDMTSCPVYDFYRQFGEEEMALFRRAWCTFDYTAAEHLVEGGRYQRTHTLSDGDDVCDMRWFIAGA